MGTPRSISLAGPSDNWLTGWGSFLLWAAFGFGLLLILMITLKASWLIPVVPVVFLVGIAGLWLFTKPLLNLTVVLCLFVLIADFEEGIQLTEVIYGLYYLSFLAHWFFTRWILEGKRIFSRHEDRLLLTFLVLVVLSLPLTMIMGGSIKGYIGELISLSLLTFYFPVKDAVERYPSGLKVMVGVVLFVGLFVLTRNMLGYRQILTDASYAWEVTRGRVVTNEGLLMVPAFFSLSSMLFVKGTKQKVIIAGFLALFLGGLILTQSRGYWAAFLFGSGILFLLIPLQKKIQMVSTGLLIGFSLLGLALLFFGDFVILIVSGLLDRFLSIATASSKDISLVNRLIETGAVWDKIKFNPILGYGMGVPYRVFDIIYDWSKVKAFVHNGYISLWFKFGIWGPTLFFSFLGITLRRGYLVIKKSENWQLPSIVCLAVIGSFAAFSISALTSNPFYINDPMFIVAVMTGLVGGSYSLHRRSVRI